MTFVVAYIVKRSCACASKAKMRSVPESKSRVHVGNITHPDDESANKQSNCR